MTGAEGCRWKMHKKTVMPARKPTTAAKKMVTQEVEAPAPAPQLQAGHWLQVRLPQTVGRWPAASAKARTLSTMSPCQKGETSMNERAGPNKKLEQWKFDGASFCGRPHDSRQICLKTQMQRNSRASKSRPSFMRQGRTGTAARTKPRNGHGTAKTLIARAAPTPFH